MVAWFNVEIELRSELLPTVGEAFPREVWKLTITILILFRVDDFPYFDSAVSTDEVENL